MKALAALGALSLVSCAIQVREPHFDGPGTFQEFAEARYACLQETRAPLQGAVANQYIATAKTEVLPDCTAFDACLAAKGYYRAPTGRLDASSIPVKCHK